MHRKVSNIGAPDVVGAFDLDAAQQVRIHLVTRRGAAQVGLGVVRFQAHEAHQPLHAFAIHAQFDGDFAAAKKRPQQIQLVDAAHQREGFRGLRLGRVVVARPRHAQQFALPLDAQSWMFRIDP